MKTSSFNLPAMATVIALSLWPNSRLSAGVPLAVRRTNAVVVVSWPYPSTGFGLEFSTNLPGWQVAAGGSVSNNGSWQVARLANQPRSFFRLKNHLQHFGFWAGSLAPQGSIVEQSGSVNFTYLQAGFSAPLADQAVAARMRLLVPSPDFNDASAVNAIRPYTNSLLAFFMMDEPDCVAGGNTNSLNTLLTSIETEVAKVHANFPGAKTMFTVGCGFWTYSNFRIPNGIDYIAIESYGSTGDPGTTKNEWLAKIGHLKPLMNGSQRIFLMPGATEGYGTESQLIDKANDIFNYAQTDPVVIGVFPFDWYSDNYDCARVGQFCGNGVPATNYFIPVIGRRSARDLPNLRARYIQIGQSIMNGPLLDVGPGGPSTKCLGGSALPSSPWAASQSGGTLGTTVVVDFFDPELGATNQALRINSGANATEWSVGPLNLDELAVGARFRLVAFSPTGRENLLCLTTHSVPLSPAPAITLVDGRFKLWSYVKPETIPNPEIMDLGPADANVWHTAYLYARKDGKVKLWWDGNLVFDGTAPLVNPFHGYVEWGSGAWQYDATTTVDFDWVAYSNYF